ncbi:MAG TPA: D-aminoacyl-tRNA deacylase [Chthonomonadales bacterium]|nr:D-aminoacyl-tRNA deacylase [Chthonomonadales bacterium]
MRAVVQRVRSASIVVDNQTVAHIGGGVVVLVGVHANDTADDARYVAGKTAHLRVFRDGEGRMNRSLLEAGGEALVVSQFTLFGDVRRGRRPSFTEAASGKLAEELYLEVARRLSEDGVPVQTGVFGAMMDVQLVNDGPVTILLDSARAF